MSTLKRRLKMLVKHTGKGHITDSVKLIKGRWRRNGFPNVLYLILFSTMTCTTYYITFYDLICKAFNFFTYFFGVLTT